MDRRNNVTHRNNRTWPRGHFWCGTFPMSGDFVAVALWRKAFPWRLEPLLTGGYFPPVTATTGQVVP
jgi:hypothetical protein